MAPNLVVTEHANAESAPATPGFPPLRVVPSKRTGAGAKKATKAAVLPTKRAPFTLGDLRAAIPPHCFKPTLRESFWHLGLDLVQVAGAMALVVVLDGVAAEHGASMLLRAALWIAYWAFQGVTMTGVWVVGHECGHGGFSTSQTINDIVGFVLHTCLYVPYFAWQRTHSNHHHFTNNLARDEVFVPTKHDGVAPITPPKERNTVLTAIHLLSILVFGWPLYLVANVSSHAAPGFNSHFLPQSSIFNDRDRVKVMLSSVGLIAWTFALIMIGRQYGSLLVLALYLPPLLITNGFLVSITYLQHTDLSLPHYDEGEWTWLRGALCTVDRTMGRFLDVKLHFIHSTHVCHHIFSKLPFYHAEEATRAIIPVLGKYYNKDDGNFALTLYRNFAACNYLENTKGIVYWVEEHLG